jgi:hypothetical protein
MNLSTVRPDFRQLAEPPDESVQNGEDRRQLLFVDRKEVGNERSTVISPRYCGQVVPHNNGRNERAF